MRASSPRSRRASTRWPPGSRRMPATTTTTWASSSRRMTRSTPIACRKRSDGSARAVLRRRSGSLLGLIVAALALAACARSSPEVVVYTSEDQVFSEPVLKAFEKASGIKVRAVYDTEETKSTGVALRIVAERQHPQADVFWANEPLRTVMLQRQGLLEPYRSPNAADIPSRYRDPDGHWTGFSARARVILYNTNEVKAPDAPSSVRDLT